LQIAGPIITQLRCEVLQRPAARRDGCCVEVPPSRSAFLEGGVFFDQTATDS